MMLEQEIEKYLSGQTLCNCDSVSYRNIKNLILGFAEPREKRIAELEKENNKLESRNDNLVKMYNEVVERQNSFQQSLYKNIEELEKENAELKKEVEKHKWNDIFLEESAFYDKKIAEEYTTLQERIAELEKENAELKAQVEKMKCCENCKHSDTECEGHTVCNIGHFFECLSNKIFDHTTNEKDYWEISE